MKKIIFTILMLTMIFSVSAILLTDIDYILDDKDKDKFTNIGDINTFEIDLKSNDIKYKLKQDFILTSFNIPLTYNFCWDTEIFDYIDENGTTINKIECDTFYNSITNDNKIIVKSEIKSLKFSSKEYTFDNKKCWICGEYIACLYDIDGGTSVKNRALKYQCDNNNYPIIRSGETGFIEVLK